MAFFNNLSKTLSEKGKEAVKKAKDLTETMQLKGQINTEENNINEVFLKIGKLAFESQLNAERSEYEEYFEIIHTVQEKIAQLQAEIEQIEGIRICKNCGAKIACESSFCNNCGMKIDVALEIVEGEFQVVDETKEDTKELVLENLSQLETMERKCPACGEILENEAKFCSICGQKIESYN